jgi:hypothetical protein
MHHKRTQDKKRGKNFRSKIETGKFGKPPVFVGEEAVKYAKLYLKKRENPAPESLLFTNNKDPNKEINTKDVSRAFKIAAQKLAKTGKITFEVRKGKPSELHLSSLIAFYKINAKDYLTEQKSSKSKDDEFYRKLYEEKAMHFLETETLTPEIYKLKKQLGEVEQALKTTRHWFSGHIHATKAIEQEMKEEIEKRDRQIKEIQQQMAIDHEYISSILTLLYNNKGDYETGENITLGDAFVDLWKKTAAEQHKNLMDAWNRKAKLIPYEDILESLTKELRRILKPYEELKAKHDNAENKNKPEQHHKS